MSLSRHGSQRYLPRFLTTGWFIYYPENTSCLQRKYCRIGMTVPCKKMVWGSQEPDYQREQIQTGLLILSPHAPASPVFLPTLLPPIAPSVLTWLLMASLEVGRASRHKGRRQDHWGVKVRGRGAGDLITLPPLPSHPASPIPTPPTSDFSLQVKPGRWVNRITHRLCNFLLLVFALSFQCPRGMPICSPKPPHSTGDTAHPHLGQQGGRWEVTCV